MFIKDYDFHRVAFADNIKIEMNQHLRETIFNFIKSNGKNKEYNPLFFDELENGIFLSDGRTLTLEMVNFQTEDDSIKKRLRPFIIWYGEKLRKINGPYYWINKALDVDARGFDRIILSDVRRTRELDIFRNSTSLNSRRTSVFAKSGAINQLPNFKTTNYSSFLFHVNQLNLEDSDTLTHECIRIAQENWLFDYTFFLDPDIPEARDYRDRAITHQVSEVVDKFKIFKINKSLNFPYKQTSILDDL
jgi:hypothetical protein